MISKFYLSPSRGEVYEVFPNWGVERVCYAGPIYDVQRLSDEDSSPKSWELMCYDCHGDDFVPISKEEFDLYYELMRLGREQALQMLKK